jgi:transcriptional regulator with XRE-family HTH domain
MNREEWTREASSLGTLGEREAEALYRRQNGESRQEAAEAMDCSASNVDNLERSARSKIIRASNMMALAGVIDAGPEDDAAAIGSCAHCDSPSTELSIHPEDYDESIEDARMVCPECADELDE